MTPWRLLLDESPRDGATNMALDEALFRDAEEGRQTRPVLRLYGWSPPCLSLGYHQDPALAADAQFCQRNAIDIVRRPTGGLAVLHDDEVTYAVAGPFGAEPFRGLDLGGTYAVLAGALVEGLASLGLPAVLSRRQARAVPSSTAPCFQVPTADEVLVHGRKVVGSAQRRGRRAFLQHGAVPLSVDYALLLGATGRPGADPAPYRAAFAGLKDFLPGLTQQALRAALLEGFRLRLDASFEK